MSQPTTNSQLARKGVDPYAPLRRRIVIWRSWRDLIAGVPALLAFLGIAYLGVLIATSKGDNQLLASYSHEGTRAFQKKEFQTAEICFRRLMVESTSDRDQRAFQVASVAIALGDHARADSLLNRLAPSDRAGYAPAHLMRAQLLLNKAGGIPSARKVAEDQLELAIKKEPNLIEAHILLGQLYCNQGRPADAEPHLLTAIPAKPGLRLLLANAYAAKGDKEQTAKHAKELLSSYLTKAEAVEADETAILVCGQAYLLLDDYAGAVGVLRKGLNFKASQNVRAALIGVYVAWTKAIEKASPSDPAARLRLIQEGLRLAPNDVRLLQPLLDLTKQKGAEADEARSLMERMVVEGPPSATVDLLLGMDAWQRGQPAEARVLLEQAFRLDPGASLVANNLAWMLAQATPPDLTRALALSDAAIKQLPDNPHFRDTRGQILLKLERWEDALTELKLAQRGMPKDPNVHTGLATAYDKLGLSELAGLHRKQAESKPEQR